MPTDRVPITSDQSPASKLIDAVRRRACPTPGSSPHPTLPARSQCTCEVWRTQRAIR